MAFLSVIRNIQIISNSKKNDKTFFITESKDMYYFFHSLTNEYKIHLLTFKNLIIKLLDFSK